MMKLWSAFLGAESTPFDSSAIRKYEELALGAPPGKAFFFCFVLLFILVL